MKAILPAILVAIAFLLGRLSVGDRQASIGVSDALPEPLHGKDLMVPYLEQKIATLKRLLGEVDGATGATLSLEAKEGLRHYYGARIQSANEMLDFCNRLQP